MDERSIDVAPSASLDMMALNKTVVNARSVVRKAKTHLINKLVRNVTDLKKKKGSEQQKEKNLKKAQRFLEEIDSMRTLKDDKIFKYALANVAKFEEVAKSTVSPAARAMARLADHRLIQEVVQKFRAEQSDWRDLAAFMLMKQTGRKFKSAKQGDKTKGKKERKDVEKVNRAENVRASKLMTDVYTQGLFREDEFQKAKETVESDSKGELNFLQKRRLKLANDKKEKQKQKLNSQTEQSKVSLGSVDNSSVKYDSSNNESGEGDEDSEEILEAADDDDDDNDDSGSDESGEESDESDEEELLEKLDVPNSTKNDKGKIRKSTKSRNLEEEDEKDTDGDDDDDEEEEEKMEVSDDESEEQVSEDESEEQSMESEEEDDVTETPTVVKNSEKNRLEISKSKKTREKEKVELQKSKKNNEKGKVVPLGSTKNSEKNRLEPQISKKDKVVPLGSETKSESNNVESIKLMSNKNKECVVKQLDLGSAMDESGEEESDEESPDSTDEEEKSKQSKRTKDNKAVPKFLTAEAPKSKKLPKDSFFEGGDFDSESEDSEKEGSDDGGNESKDEDADSEAIVGNRGKIKSMIYNQGGARGAGRGRGRGRGANGRGGGGNNEGKFKFGGKDKKGKKPFGRGGGADDGPFSFGNKEVMYKRRNQTIITEEGKTKIVTEKKESKPKLHPSWEASRKRKAEQSGGIKAFAGKRISFDDD